MGIEIRRLTPEMAEDYVSFFDVTPHNVNMGGGKCYCVTWRSDDSYTGNGDHWFPTPEERRARALGSVSYTHLAPYSGRKNRQVALNSYFVSLPSI